MNMMLPPHVAVRCQYPIGISLVVEWLRLLASIAGGMCLILSWGCRGTKNPVSCTVWPKKKNILFQDGEKPSGFPSWQFIYLKLLN